MPVWVQIVGGTTAVIALLAGVWSKVLRPGAALITSTEEMLPLLRDLTSVFRDKPGVFSVLDQIAAQFRTDSGSSLRDVVNRLEAAAVENRRAGEALKVGVEASRLLSERDRQQLDRIMIAADRLATRVDTLIASGARIETARAQVAVDLIAREEKVDAASSGVASDLAASRHQADVAEGEPGVAADAGAITPITESGDTVTPANPGGNP